jgi:hypothetical protein
VICPNDVIWKVAPPAQNIIQPIRESMSSKEYEDGKKKLQQFICDYVNSAGGQNCLNKQGKSISPIGKSREGGKLLKIRWSIHNAGKSSGFRFIFSLHCKERIAWIMDAVIRKDA